MMSRIERPGTLFLALETNSIMTNASISDLRCAGESQYLVSVITAILLGAPLAACTTLAGREHRPAAPSYECMRAVVSEKLPPDLPEKRAHCLGAGLIARYCSVSEAYLAGAGKELRDVLGAGDADWTDWQADRAGIDCARHVQDDSGIASCCAERGH
jgi:hypothetical protein